MSVPPSKMVSFFPSPLRAIQPGLRPSQLGLRPSQPGLRPSQPGLNPSQPGLRPSQLSLKPEGGTNGRTDGRTNKQKISPFYRTLSPIGAAALPPPMKTKEKVEQGKGTADHLMPLGYLFLFDIQVSFILIPFFFLFFSFSSVFFFFFCTLSSCFYHSSFLQEHI